MEIKLTKIFSQNDEEWRKDRLGLDGTIGGVGCLMTCVAMLLNWFGHDETPKTLNQKMNNNEGYLGNFWIWQTITAIFPDISWGNLVGGLVDPLTDAQMKYIKARIDEGYPVLLQIDNIPATSKLDEHWVLAFKYDGDDFFVADPWDGAVKRITSWGVQPQKLIYAYAYYKGKPVATVKPTITIPVEERDWLVEGATVRKQVAEYLQISSPDHTPFDSIQRVIAGIKSSVTDYQSKWQTELTERKNRDEQIGRLKDQLIEEGKLREDLTKKLNDVILNTPTITKVYEDRITVLQGQIDNMGKEKGELNNQLKDCKLQNPVEKLTAIDCLLLAIKKLRG